MPLVARLHIDGRVILFTIAVATARRPAGRPRAGPAGDAREPRGDLKGDAGRSRAGRRWTIRDGLVVLQTAVTLVLLVAAGLLTRSILQAQNVNLGFRAEGRRRPLTELGLIGYDEERAASQFFGAPPSGSARSRASPRSRARCASRSRSTTTATRIYFPESRRREIAAPRSPPRGSTSTYFETLGVPLLRGRDFTAAEPADVREGRDRERGVRAPLLAGREASDAASSVAHRGRADYQVVGVVGD